jgi:hypothetical protein
MDEGLVSGMGVWISADSPAWLGARQHLAKPPSMESLEEVLAHAGSRRSEGRGYLEIVLG